MRASPMCCRRARGSRRRHRRISRVTARGTSGRSALQSGSSRRRAAATSDTERPREHRPAGQHLVEHAAERPDVRPRVDVPARHLLRAHVAGGADDEADLGDRLDGLLHVALHRRRLGEAEVDELHLTPGREHHVRRLEIAVDHALGVRLFEPGDDLHRDRERLFEGHRPAGQAVRQRFTLHPLEDEVGRAIHPLEAVDRGDVRMAERGEDPRLAFEAPQAPRVAAKRVGQALDRDLAAQAGIERPVDAPHAARAQQIEDLIAADVLSEDEAIAGGVVRDPAPGRCRRCLPRAIPSEADTRFPTATTRAPPPPAPLAASPAAGREGRNCRRSFRRASVRAPPCDSSRTAPSSVFRRAGSDRGAIAAFVVAHGDVPTVTKSGAEQPHGSGAPVSYWQSGSPACRLA